VCSWTTSSKSSPQVGRRRGSGRRRHIGDSPPDVLARCWCGACGARATGVESVGPSGPNELSAIRFRPTALRQRGQIRGCLSWVESTCRWPKEADIRGRTPALDLNQPANDRWRMWTGHRLLDVIVGRFPRQPSLAEPGRPSQFSLKRLKSVAPSNARSWPGVIDPVAAQGRLGLANQRGEFPVAGRLVVVGIGEAGATDSGLMNRLGDVVAVRVTSA
jgi:hypothetical protein